MNLFQNFQRFYHMLQNFDSRHNVESMNPSVKLFTVDNRNFQSNSFISNPSIFKSNNVTRTVIANIAY